MVSIRQCYRLDCHTTCKVLHVADRNGIEEAFARLTAQVFLFLKGQHVAHLKQCECTKRILQAILDAQLLVHDAGLKQPLAKVRQKQAFEIPRNLR